MGMIRFSVAWGALLVAVSAAAPVHAAPTMAQAEQLLRVGRYTQAEAAFGQLSRKAKLRPRALLGIARARFATGRLGTAVQAARKAAKGKLAPVALTLAAEVLLRMGQVSRAEQTAKAVLAKHPRHLRAMVQLGLALRAQGKYDEGGRAFYRLYDEFDAGRIDESSAEQLMYVALACRYTDNFRDAGDTLAQATKADPKFLEAWMQRGLASLVKYEAGWAERHFMRVLKVNPHHVDALVGMARVRAVQSGDFKEVGRFLDRAHKVNPHSVELRVLRAEMLLDADRNLEAEALLTKALARNPRHLEALSMMATSFYLRDDLGSFERTRARVLKLNPRYTKFFHIVVRLAVRHHRYAESIKLSQRAIKIDPKDWYAQADLGTNYLRLGDDKRGLKHLRAAWQGDRFNVRTFNLLNLYDDVLAKQYTFISSKNFRLRVHKQEAKLLHRTVVPLLERAFASYVKRYRFKPKTPIVIELFQNRQHYAIRTVGLPGLGALGVCFGQLITAISPTNGIFNWGQVLWHELNHVFTIQLSRSRVPRWLTEGLADMEPTLLRPEWKRERDFELYAAMQAGRVRPVGQLSLAFTQARSMADMEVAYYQGSLVARYLIKHWGLAKVVRALRAFGKSQRVEQVLPAITGISLKELDRRFWVWQRQRLARQARSWFVDLARYQDLAARQRAARANPNDASAQAHLAVARFAAGKAAEAKAAAARALAKDGKHKLAVWVMAQVLLREGAREKARTLLLGLIALGADGYQLRVTLGRMALARKDLRDARLQLQAASRLDPDQALPHKLLAQAFERAGKTKQTVAQLKAYVLLDQHSFVALSKLLELLHKAKDHAGLRTFGAMAYYVNPASARVHSLLAEAYQAAAPTADLRRAVRHLELALLCKPKSPVALHLRLARIHLLRKDQAAARRQVDQALAVDPDSKAAKALKAQLGP